MIFDWHHRLESISNMPNLTNSYLKNLRKRRSANIQIIFRMIFDNLIIYLHSINMKIRALKRKFTYIKMQLKFFLYFLKHSDLGIMLRITRSFIFYLVTMKLICEQLRHFRTFSIFIWLTANVNNNLVQSKLYFPAHNFIKPYFFPNISKITNLSSVKYFVWCLIQLLRAKPFNFFN
ncbi:hypothetical protein BpHYR1_046940 [Brachionus plicatilis]|uniref:Uncharacterized protein n=1 Tax=Brachionus plicatilis TaxID=10195 RepID=A0A3M7RH28_BRAPC|nr:hypothetical protein BpHYR1_046940 [Brachionus plicatilis]